jgi:predicted transcriptional regulator
MTQTTMKFTAKQFGPARARADDPVQSHAAADRRNATSAGKKQGMAVLRSLKLHGDQTAKFLDSVMPTANVNWDGWAHRRMPELVSLGYVRRYGTGRNLICSITEKGKELLRKENKR